MSNNKEKIKTILNEYVDIDNNYKKIKHQIYTKQNNKQFIRRLSIVVPVILFLISVGIIIGNNKIFNLSGEKTIDNGTLKDNIIINKVENIDDNSMYYNYESTDSNLIDNILIYKYLEEKESFEIIIQKTLYNKKQEKIYFGGYKYTEDDSKFVYLYITPNKNNNFLYENVFENTQNSLINNHKVYIVDNQGIIFIKVVKNKEIYVIQTNITNDSIYIELVKELIDYQE